MQMIQVIIWENTETSITGSALAGLTQMYFPGLPFIHEKKKNELIQVIIWGNTETSITGSALHSSYGC